MGWREGSNITAGRPWLKPVGSNPSMSVLLRKVRPMPEKPALPFVLPAGSGRRIDMGTFAMHVKASGDDTLAAFSLLESSEPSGFGPPMHIHRDCAEAFYVIEGEYLMFIDGNEWVCAAGSFVYVPTGVPHTFKVGAVAGRKLNLYVPSAMVGYFDELAAASSRGAPTEEELTAIALRYGMEVVGPVPDSYT